MDQFTYVVERFDVSGECEQLIQRAELVPEGGDLVCLVQGEGARLLGSTDVPSAIASEPVLSEIRANEVTRIVAAGSAYEALPFVLQIPGELDDFDSTLWSTAMAEDHTTDWNEDQCVFRVAYVNDRRWCAYPTVNEGPRMLREARMWPEVLLMPRWGCLFIADDGREDAFKIGLLTERAIVSSYAPDDPMAPQLVSLWERTPDVRSDASMVVDWLLDWVPKQLGPSYGVHRQVLAQLLVEVAVNGNSGVDFPTSYLSAGNEAGLVDTGNAVLNLELDLPAEAMTVIVDLIAERNPQMAEIVTAAVNPESEQAKSRRTAIEKLGQWALDLELSAALQSLSGDADEAESDFDEDDPNAPWNRDPGELLPAVIEPGRIPLRFWKSDFAGGWVLYDFVFTWNGGQEADWYYDISMENDGLSVMSSAPASGAATWIDGRDVEITYRCAEFDLDDTAPLGRPAPAVDSLELPSTWVSLGSGIAGYIDGLIA